MVMAKRVFYGLLVALSVCLVSACSNDHTQSSNLTTTKHKAAAEAVVLDVYKDPNCGCCSKWVDHLKAEGLSVAAHNTNDLDQLKAKYGISPENSSCHTGVSKDGYVFEGHVPAKYVRQFLSEKPKGAYGLAVPGMPVGSPGMEMGQQRDSYQVMQLNLDGSTSVYAYEEGS
ncbi:hypothetical protein GCM10022277_29580 [Litoribacillus peritrichatus]|uniref:DUF411 domain-containing protein n=2 Tax=Litoribacillus peritrichatus TaxID=718191 RepID=A0ABP7MVH2_9GAMM